MARAFLAAQLLDFSKFGLVGIVNTGVGYGAIALATLAFSAPPVVANAIGYGLGILVSFFLNKAFTFRGRKTSRLSLPIFLGVFLFCYGLNVLVLIWLLEHSALPELLAQAVAMAVYTVPFFLLSKLLVFRAQSY